jgi:hypothetical protein
VDITSVDQMIQLNRSLDNQSIQDYDKSKVIVIEHLNQVNMKFNQEIKKTEQKKLIPLQQALKNIQMITKRFGYSISGKQIRKTMMNVFLTRFPNGTDLCGGQMSSKNNIKKASVSNLNDATQEWIRREGYSCVQTYFDQDLNDN